MKDLPIIVGKNIRKYRLSRQMTREKLAEAMDLDTAYLGQCERGERQLGLSKTIQIIEYFGITPNDLIPVNCSLHQEQHELYLRRLQESLAGCTDAQMAAILQLVQAVLPCLKE